MSTTPLDGRWQMIRAELSGDAAPEVVVQRTRLEIAAGRYTISFDGRMVDAGACDLITVAATQAMVLRADQGTHAGRVIRCIYQLVGDRLRICYGLDSSAPTTFTTAAGDARYLATYRRLA